MDCSGGWLRIFKRWVCAYLYFSRLHISKNKKEATLSENFTVIPSKNPFWAPQKGTMKATHVLQAVLSNNIVLDIGYIWREKGGAFCNKISSRKQIKNILRKTCNSTHGCHGSLQQGWNTQNEKSVVYKFQQWTWNHVLTCDVQAFCGPNKTARVSAVVTHIHIYIYTYAKWPRAVPTFQKHQLCLS